MSRSIVVRLAPALLLAFTAVSAPRPAAAQTGYPMVISVFPVGCQRGKTTEITVSGQFNFAGAYGTLFDRPGVTAEIVAPNPPPKEGKSQDAVRPHSRPPFRPARARPPTSASRRRGGSPPLASW